MSLVATVVVIAPIDGDVSEIQRWLSERDQPPIVRVDEYWGIGGDRKRGKAMQLEVWVGAFNYLQDVESFPAPRGLLIVIDNENCEDPPTNLEIKRGEPQTER